MIRAIYTSVITPSRNHKTPKENFSAGGYPSAQLSAKKGQSQTQFALIHALPFKMINEVTNDKWQMKYHNCLKY